MSSVIDGRPINGPVYPSWSNDAEAEAQSQGHVQIPTDHLGDSPEGRAVSRSHIRLTGAFRLLAGALGGTTALLSRGGHASLAADAVRLADQVIAANDQFDTSPHHPPSPPQPAYLDTSAAVTLLRHLAESGPLSAETWAVDGLNEYQMGQARWRLRKEGLAEYGRDGCLTLTERGKEVMGVKAVAAVNAAVPAADLDIEAIRQMT